VDGVLVFLLPELEGEEGVLAPWHVLLDVDLVLVVGQVGVTLAANRPEVNLKKGPIYKIALVIYVREIQIRSFG